MTIAFLLVCLLSILVGGLSWGTVAGGLAVFVCVAFFTVAFDRSIRQVKRIEISDTHVSGQSGSVRNLFRRISIARNEIDFQRSSRRSWWWRWQQCGIIWSKDGRYIYLDSHVLGKDQVREILEQLGIRQVDV